METKRICGLKQDETGQYYIADHDQQKVVVPEPVKLKIVGDTFQAAVFGKRKDIVPQTGETS